MEIKSKEVLAFIQAALIEDIGDGDHTSLSTVPAEARGKAKLLVKDDGILAGVELAKAI
ncbi:MAG: nicotinate-nucleotide pyrophosphorylase (carboxylating), partial [Algoriphagus sp.]